jgi:hypothetical protein
MEDRALQALVKLGKLSRSVLESSGGGDSFTDFNPKKTGVGHFPQYKTHLTSFPVIPGFEVSRHSAIN